MKDDQGSGARILIVEDDQVLSDLIAKVVSKLGHQPICAHTGEQALSILQDPKETVDWLLTDIRLPGAIDGWVVGSEFTLNHPLRPVVYISAVEHDALWKRGRNSIFLPKPIDVSALAATFRQLESDHNMGSRT